MYKARIHFPTCTINYEEKKHTHTHTHNNDNNSNNNNSSIINNNYKVSIETHSLQVHLESTPWLR
jgi:hypothetical protein